MSTILGEWKVANGLVFLSWTQLGCSWLYRKLFTDKENFELRCSHCDQVLYGFKIEFIATYLRINLLSYSSYNLAKCVLVRCLTPADPIEF